MAALYALPQPDERAVRAVNSEDPVPYDGQAQEKQKFTMVPEIVRQMNDGFAVAVFEAIARNDNGNHECWPSIATLCERTGWSRKIVEPAIKRLIAAGALVRENRVFKGMKQSNVYRITAWDQIVPTEPTLAPTERTIVPTAPTDSSEGTNRWFPQNDKEEPVNLKPIQQEPEETIPPTPTIRADPKPKKTNTAPKYSAEFIDGFWSVYPNHVRNTKSEAWDQWQRLSDEDRADAVRVLPLFAATESWRTGFAPAAQRWLSKRKWEDPPKPQATSSGLAVVGGQRPSRAQTAVERALAIGRGEA